VPTIAPGAPDDARIDTNIETMMHVLQDAENQIIMLEQSNILICMTITSFTRI
jgi:hypothetical protein